MQENVFFFLKAKNSVKYLYDNISVEDGLALTAAHAQAQIYGDAYY